MAANTIGLMAMRLAVMALALVLVGCTGDGTNASSTPLPPDDARLEELARDLMLDDPPRDAQFERYVTPDEWAPVMVQCLNEQGIPADVSRDGGIEYGDVPMEQAQTQSEALYRCRVRFPTDPRYEQPLTPAQIRIVYDYQTGPLTDCLEREGYTVAPPPSAEAFISSYYDPETEVWSAYPMDDPRLNDMDEWYRLNEVCPQLPPNEELFGSD